MFRTPFAEKYSSICELSREICDNSEEEFTVLPKKFKNFCDVH